MKLVPGVYKAQHISGHNPFLVRIIRCSDIALDLEYITYKQSFPLQQISREVFGEEYKIEPVELVVWMLAKMKGQYDQ